jgi:hypothetical protein
MKTTEGNRWLSFKLGNENLKYTKIGIVEERLADADNEGKPIEKKQITKATYKYFKADGTEYNGQICKLFNGEIVDKTELTKEVANEDIAETEISKVFDLISDDDYLVSCSETLTEQLKERALQFPFNNGFGFKPKIAVVFYDTITSCVIMRLGRAKRSKIINGILQTQAIKNKAKEEITALQSKTKHKTIKAEEL